MPVCVITEMFNTAYVVLNIIYIYVSVCVCCNSSASSSGHRTTVNRFSSFKIN